ncbi:MAG: UDP-N-acetylmuramoyl-tripeptide--D-alanyl-D-alanine ligase [Prolixibacteraceae bacterium]|nr:UDP-N-acetylmuramoyl-tripeptide--D-alanyl-D-alanine ligase [Prolixibacteraceae bacterium]
MKNIEALYELYLKWGKVFTDSRLAAQGGLFFALKGERFDANDFALQALAQGANCAVVDRADLSGHEGCFFVDNALEALQQLANYHRKQLSIPVLAITGSNGKTTSKELITAVLKQKFNVLSTQGNLNNHIGVPLTLLDIKPEHQIAVVEMGANHMGEIDFLCRIAQPDFGLITNVGKAHIEGFGSFEGVKQTKTEMYRYLTQNDGKGIFINLSNQNLRELLPQGVDVLSYATGGEKADLVGEVVNNDRFLLTRALFAKGWLYLKTNLTGAYNFENVLAAARIGLHFGVDPLQIQKAIGQYVPQNKRSQIFQKGDATFLLDCYNANPSSMAASISNFIEMKGENKAMVLGDMLELGHESETEHQKIVDMLAEQEVSEIYLVGACFEKTQSPLHFQKFKNVEALMQALEPTIWNNKFILVKGSRGIKLEQIVEG